MQIYPTTRFDFLSAVLDNKVTFTRSGTTATRVNSNGLIESVAADTARFDFDPVTKSCRGLLVEQSRTNLVTQSADFSTWSANKVSVTLDEVGPDGNVSAYTLAEDDTFGYHRIQLLNLFTVDGNTRAWSLYVKAGTAPYIAIMSYGADINSPGSSKLVYNTVSKTYSAWDASVTPIPPVDSGNGWYRIGFSSSLNNASYDNFRIEFNDTGTVTSGHANYTGKNRTVKIWHAQTELGTFYTSPIFTAGSIVTRNADAATITSTAFSGFWRSGPGSILVRALPSTVSGTRPLVQVDDATADNIIALRGNTTNPELYIRAGGSDQATIDAGTISAAAYRLAGAWQAGSAAASLNSGLAVNGAPASIPAPTQMRLGSDGTNYLNGHLQAVEYWPVRLGNAGLQTASSTAGYGGILAPVMQDAMLYPQINRSFGL